MEALNRPLIYISARHGIIELANKNDAGEKPLNLKGSLTAWNDAKGFGFITPESSGERVFAHISAYSGRGRPSVNRKVVYTQGKDGQGRLRAAQFQYPGAARIGASMAPGVWLALLVAAGFLGGLAGLFVLGIVPLALPAACLAMSLVTFVLYAMDKGAAERGDRRIPENRLHLFDLLGGWPGALIAQQLFRHKTRKGSFQSVYWLCVLLNLTALGWLLFWPEAFFVRQELGVEQLQLNLLSNF